LVAGLAGGDLAAIKGALDRVGDWQGGQGAVVLVELGYDRRDQAGCAEGSRRILDQHQIGALWCQGLEPRQNGSLSCLAADDGRQKVVMGEVQGCGKVAVIGGSDRENGGNEGEVEKGVEGSRRDWDAADGAVLLGIGRAIDTD